MAMHRRGMIGALIGGAVAGPKVATDFASSLAGNGADLPPESPYPPAVRAAGMAIPDYDTPENWRRVLANKVFRSQIESIYYEEYRAVPGIDPDIAVLRSFSPMAKVTFQRQRNVESRMRSQQEQYMGRRIRELAMKALGFTP